MDTQERQVLVTNRIIECDEHIWSIQNLTNVNSRTFNLQRKDPRPGFSCGLVAFAVLVAFVSLSMLSARRDENALVWAFLVLGAIAFVISHLRTTGRKRQAYDRTNNLTVYRLSIETNSGTTSLFFSHDYDTIQRIKHAIKCAISDAQAAINQTFHINTIKDSVLKDVVINEGCEIGSQTIQGR